MTEELVSLDDSEASLALHALRFYMNIKGNEISDNTRRLEAKLNNFLDGTTFVVTTVESAASILGSRGGTKGGASTSDAKRVAAAANGSKGGRPHNPNLFIRFSKGVWNDPDLELLGALERLSGTTKWLTAESGDELEGPYARIYVEHLTEKLKKQLGSSLNVWEWDEQGFYTVCQDHANDNCKKLPGSNKETPNCLVPGCNKPAVLVY